MANTLKIKRGLAASIPQGQLAEPLFTTDTYDLYIGKGSGGNQRIQNYITSGTSSQFLKGDGSLDSTTYQATSEKGQNNGYASLDAGGKIPASQLPSSVIEYKGTWNASTNTPTLADGTGDAGDVYIVSVGGTQNLGSGSITFDAGDWVMYNGSIWQKSTGSNAVASVNGQTGIVLLDTDDISEPVSATNLWFTNARARAAISLTTTGTSGAATYDNSTGVLNIPQYQAVLTNPVTGTGTNNEIAYFNTTGSTIASLSTATYPSLTELSYVKGVTSAIQTQLNAKEPTVTKGNLTETTSSVLTITGGTGAVIGSGTTIAVAQSSGSTSGYLSSTDWTTFNSKQAQLNGTGFVKASGTTISYDNSTYLTTSAAASTYVPYSGATTNVNLGIYGLTAGVNLIANYNDTTPGASASRNVIQATTSFTPAGGTNQKTDWKNFNASFTINTTGTLTNYYGYYATAPTVTSGTITNKYSFYGASGAGIGYFADGMTLAGALSGTSATFQTTLTPLVLKGTNATTMWTEYYYNTSTLSGYIGSGSGILSGALATDFIFRSEGDYVVATGGNNRRLTISSTGAATFSSSVTANGTMQLADDGTYGSTYKMLAFTGNTNGSHRIFAGTADDIYIAAATGRGIRFWTNGSSANVLTLASTGAATFSSSVTAANFYVPSSNEIRFYNSNSGNWGTIKGSTDAVNGYITLTGGSGNGMIIANNGNIGIGTGTSPANILEISTTSKLVSDRTGVNLTTSNATAADIGLPLVWSSNGTISNYATASIAGRRESASGGDYSGYLQFATTTSAGSLTERMRITSGGAVQATNNLTANSPSAGNTGEGIIAGTSFKIDASGTGQKAKMYVVSKDLSDTYGSGLQIQFANQADDKGFGFNLNTSGGYETYVKNSSGSFIRIEFITQGGLSRFSNNGTYTASTNQHEFNNNNTSNFVTGFYHRNTTPFGLQVEYTAADPNGTGSQFLNCQSTGGLRAEIRSNGGLANYSANDVNLSDIRTKKDIAPLDSYWNKFKELDFVKFKYKDQSHDDYNIGLIAQQVEKIAPEFIDADGWGKTPEDGVPLKTIYTTDLYHAAMAVLKEALIRIEKLENK